MAAWWALLYGIAMIAGGLLGFRRAGSRPSLIGGLVVGGFSILGAIGMFGGTVSGRGIALLGASLAVLFFGWTLSRAILNEKRVHRPLALLVASVLTAAVVLWGAG